MSVEEAGRARWLRDHGDDEPSAAERYGITEEDFEEAGLGMADGPRTVYISIGNSDDKLSQADWSLFVANVHHLLSCSVTATHGEWYSLPGAPFQNACFCVEFSSQEQVESVKSALAGWAKSYRQESIAWADAETTFIKPAP
jgi:hypothetical protein